MWTETGCSLGFFSKVEGMWTGAVMFDSRPSRTIPSLNPTRLPIVTAYLSSGRSVSGNENWIVSCN